MSGYHFQDLRGVCEHPLSDISIAGEAVHPLPSTFHTLLQTIADLMLLLPMGSALQQMAIRCWGLRFTQSDHMFLHRSVCDLAIRIICVYHWKIKDMVTISYSFSDNERPQKKPGYIQESD